MNVKRMKQTGWLLVIVGVLCSLFLWGQRMQSEADYKSVQMVVNYSDIVALANANGYTEEGMAEALQARGVSAVLYKEWSLGSLNANGQIAIEVGNHISYGVYADRINAGIPINEATAYVVLLDESIAEQVASHVLAKVQGAKLYEGATAASQLDVITIPIMVPNGDGEVVTALSKIKEIGVGFDMDGIAQMTACGMDTVPQLRSWDNPTDESLRMAFDEIEAMPNLVYLLFNDKELPG